MPWTTPDGGGDQGGGGLPILAGFAPVKKKGGGPFINWSSPVSVLSSPMRFTAGATKQFTDLETGAARGVLGLGASAGKEVWHDIQDTPSHVSDVFHGRAPLFATDPRHPTSLASKLGLGQFTAGGQEEYEKKHPASGALIGSFTRTGTDVQQLARAGGNTLLPGQPLGADVGQLGEGPGLLGKTDYAQAVKRGGGGALPKVIEDIANLSLIAKPVEGVLGASADAAKADALARASEAADITKATREAEASVKEATSKFEAASRAADQAAQAARTGDPAAAAAHTAAQQGLAAAQESLRQATEFAAEHNERFTTAQQAAQAAQDTADRLAGHHRTMKLVNQLGSHAANSPFAPLTGFSVGETHVPGILGAAGQAAHAIADHSPFVQNVVDRAAHAGNTLIERSRARSVVNPIREQADIEFRNQEANINRPMRNVVGEVPTTDVPVRRGPLGLFGTKTVPIPDPDAEAVLTMAHDRVDAHLRNLLRDLPKKEAIDVFKRAMPEGQYTDHQLELAADVYDPHPSISRAEWDAHVTRTSAMKEWQGLPRSEVEDYVTSQYGWPIDPHVADIRAAIPRVREAYAPAAEAQARNYEPLAGEDLPAVRPQVTAGALEQAQHNLYGTSPRVEGLDQWQKILADYERAQTKGTKALDRAGKVLERAAAKVEGLHMSEAERANPRALFARIMAPATETARQVITAGPDAERLLASAPERGLANIGKALLSGKLDPAVAERNLASEIIKLTAKNPTGLSVPARELVEMAQDAGVGAVPRGLPNVAAATRPAEQLGAGVERAAQGARLTRQGTADIAAGQTDFGRAMERLGAPTRTPQVDVAVGRVARAAAKLGQLRDMLAAKTGRATAATRDVVPEGFDRKEVAAAIRDARAAVKAQYAAEADAIRSEMERKEIKSIEWPPPKETARVEIRKGNMKGRDIFKTRAASNVGGLDTELIYGKGKAWIDWATRNGFLGTHGESWDLIADRANNLGEGTGARGFEPDDWIRLVDTIKQAQEHARAGVNTGWDPRMFDEPRSIVEEHLAGQFGPDVAREVSRHVVHGDPAAVAGKVLEAMQSHEGVPETAVRADVTAAVEADRALEEARGGQTPPGGQRAPARAALDAQGKALYDEEVARGKVDVQGQVVGQKSGQVSRLASQGAENARQQGGREGAILGAANEQMRQGERAIGQGDRLTTSGQATVSRAGELSQQAADAVAGPVGQMYRRVGAAEQDLASAAKQYEREQAALDRLDPKLAAEKAKLEQSVAAAPRPYRPMLETGQRIKAILDPMADDAERNVGPGAGDVFRALAGEAVMPLREMVRSGVDPQFLIGQRGVIPDAGVATGRTRSGLPSVGATGQRVAGTGLKRATNYEQLTNQMLGRARRIVDNMAGQRLIDAEGGKVADLLDARGVPNARTLEPVAFADAYKDADIVAVDKSLRALPAGQITPESVAIPKSIYREFNKYRRIVPEDSLAQTFLHGYDKTTWALKRLLRLSPRWQVAITAGHSIMAMTGIGADPLTYFGHDVPLAVRLNKMARAGVLTADDHAFLDSAKVPPRVRAALEQNEGFLPGSIRNRGFVQEEFAPTGERAKLGGRGLQLQSTLDNMHRTAVWIHQLERGLDSTGLADFRAAYPDLAHLTDEQIHNEAAIRLSTRTMGDYLNRTASERAVLSRVVYFYPWLKHITKLTLNTAIHNPLRVVWLLHLGAMFDPGPAPVDFLSKSYDAGQNRWISPPNWNPYEAIVPASENPLGSLNPIITTGVAATTGYNLRTGKPVSRPSYEKGALSPMEAANFAVGQVPLLAAARQGLPALAGSGEPIVRYQTGQPILSGGRHISANEDQWLGTRTMVPGALAPFLSFTGLPRQEVIDTKALLASNSARDARDAKALLNYERQRARARR